MSTVRKRGCCSCAKPSNIQYFDRSRQSLPTPPIDTPIPPTPPLSPEIREILLTLIGSEIEVFTSFGVIVGTLVEVLEDYLVLVDETNAEIHIRVVNIESFTSV